MKNIVSALIVLFCNVCVIQASSLFKIDDNYLSQHDIVYLEPEFDSWYILWNVVLQIEFR